MDPVAKDAHEGLQRLKLGPGDEGAGPSGSSSALDHLLGQATAVSASFRDTIDRVVEGLREEKERLRAEQAQLAEERAALRAEKERVQEVFSDSSQVCLNIGGHRYTTTIQTLRNAPSPSLFSAMFSGRHTLKADETGAFFIDRDGRHFHDVLNYLRDGTLSFHPGSLMLLGDGLATAGGGDLKYLLELRAEAQYFGLIGLVDLIDRYPYAVTPVHRASAINSEDSWVYEDGQDQIVVSVDKPCQLLGVGLCGSSGALTASINVMRVDPDDYAAVLEELEVCAQTFSNAAHGVGATGGGHGAAAGARETPTVCRMLLSRPVPLNPGESYMIQAAISGAESCYCEGCLETVVAGGVTLTFHEWESPNGTNEERGQFPTLYIRPLDPVSGAPKVLPAADAVFAANQDPLATAGLLAARPGSAARGQQAGASPGGAGSPMRGGSAGGGPAYGVGRGRELYGPPGGTPPSFK